MDFGLIDKKAKISASSRGLGKACAWSLAKEGVKIFLNGVSEKSLAKTVKEFTQAGFIVEYVLGKIEDEDTRKIWHEIQDSTGNTLPLKYTTEWSPYSWPTEEQFQNSVVEYMLTEYFKKEKYSVGF